MRNNASVIIDRQIKVDFRPCYGGNVWNVYVNNEKQASYVLKYYTSEVKRSEYVLFKDYQGYKRQYEKDEVLSIKSNENLNLLIADKFYNVILEEDLIKQAGDE